MLSFKLLMILFSEAESFCDVIKPPFSLIKRWSDLIKHTQEVYTN